MLFLFYGKAKAQCRSPQQAQLLTLPSRLLWKVSEEAPSLLFGLEDPFLPL